MVTTIVFLLTSNRQVQIGAKLGVHREDHIRLGHAVAESGCCY